MIFHSFCLWNTTEIHLGRRRFIWCQVFSILMSIISPEVQAKDVSLCFTIYQFNTPSSSHLASTILVRYDITYPTKLLSVSFHPLWHLVFSRSNKWMLNTTYKLNSHNQQNHHLISYMFSLSISFLHENYLDVREDSFLHICGHTWQMYSLRHVVYILRKILCIMLILQYLICAITMVYYFLWANILWFRNFYNFEMLLNKLNALTEHHKLFFLLSL